MLQLLLVLPSGKEAIMGICAEEQPKEVMDWIKLSLALSRPLLTAITDVLYIFV